MTQATCRKCGQTKDASAFKPNIKMRRGLDSWCKECHRSGHVHCGYCSKPSHGDLFCTPICADLWNWERRSAPFVIKDCRGCGEGFVDIHPGRHRYCSTACRKEARRAQERGRGRPYDRAKALNQAHRRRTQAQRTDLSPSDIRQLLSGRTYCPLCRKRMTDDHRHPHAKHVDHIVPLAIGGTHSWGNVRVICRSCNLSRPHDGSDIAGQTTLWAQDIAGVPTLQLKPPSKRRHPIQSREVIHANAVDKAERAWAMRQAGAKWRDIATSIGYKGSGAAFCAIENALGVKPVLLSQDAA